MPYRSPQEKKVKKHIMARDPELERGIYVCRKTVSRDEWVMRAFACLHVSLNAQPHSGKQIEQGDPLLGNLNL